MNNIILITGATSGFGKAIAEKFAANGWNCIITGRRKERLQKVTDNLSSHDIKVLPLVFDVQQRDEVFTQIKSLPDEWKAIDILVNNAGLALGRDSFDNALLEDWETMIDTNVKGLLVCFKGSAALHDCKRKRSYYQYWFNSSERSVYEWKCILRFKVCGRCNKQSTAHGFVAT